MEPHDLVDGPGHHRVVGGQDQAGPLVAQAEHRPHQPLPGLTVQLGGWLVGDHQGRPADHGRRERQPLLLAPGQLLGPVAGPLLQAEGAQQPIHLARPNQSHRGGRRVLPRPCPAALLGLCAASVLAGLVDAIVGGGGLVQLSALLVVLPGGEAIFSLATNKLASVVGTASAAVTYARRVPLDRRHVVPMAAAAACACSGPNICTSPAGFLSLPAGEKLRSIAMVCGLAPTS